MARNRLHIARTLKSPTRRHKPLVVSLGRIWREYESRGAVRLRELDVHEHVELVFVGLALGELAEPGVGGAIGFGFRPILATELADCAQELQIPATVLLSGLSVGHEHELMKGSEVIALEGLDIDGFGGLGTMAIFKN